MKVLAILMLICTIQCISYAQRNNVSEIIDNLFRGYDARIRPHYEGPPVEVLVTAYILDVSSVSETNMDFTIDLYFRQSWNDERMKFSSNAGLEYILLDSNFEQKIWKPDTFYANEKKGFIHQILKTNTLIRIHPDGKVLTSQRLSITASCPMNFKYFPMDSHVCTLDVESYGMKASDITYKWSGENAVGLSRQLSLPKFNAVGHRTKEQLIQLSTGSYSRLTLDFQFDRLWGHYVVNVYIPAIFLMILSWTAFLIRNSIVRMLIGVMTCLTLLSLMNSTNAALPFVSCMKALDVYLVVCLLMAFASLVVNIFADYRAHAQSDQLPSYRNSIVQNEEKEKNALGFSLMAETGSRMGFFSKTDKISIFVLPIIFVIFNFLYFIIYFTISDVTLDGLVPQHP